MTGQTAGHSISEDELALCRAPPGKVRLRRGVFIFLFLIGIISTTESSLKIFLLKKRKKGKKKPHTNKQLNGTKANKYDIDNIWASYYEGTSGRLLDSLCCLYALRIVF